MMRFLPIILIFFLSTLVEAASLKSSKIDVRAQSVAKLLKPASFSKGSEKDLAGMKSQMIRLIEELEKSQRTSHAAPQTMISKAYEFRQHDIPRSQAMVSQSALLSAWREASSMGLFNEDGEFTDKISKGSGKGDGAVFEYIVPPSVEPNYTKFIGNLRLVREDRVRSPGAEISTRDRAFINSLAQLKSEAATRNRMLDREKSKVAMKKVDLNEIGQTREQAEAIYQQEVKDAGDLAKQPPGIRIQGKLLTRPGHMNNNRYRVGFNITNTSRHPTEITVEYWVLGFTDKLNKIYVMKKETQTLKLRKGQASRQDVWTNSVNHYGEKAWELDDKKSKKVSYKGFIAFVKFGDKVIGQTASDARLSAYGTGERSGMETWPKF